MAETVRIEIPIETVDNTDPELSKVTQNLNKMKDAADKANSSTKKAGEIACVMGEREVRSASGSQRQDYSGATNYWFRLKELWKQSMECHT